MYASPLLRCGGFGHKGLVVSSESWRHSAVQQTELSLPRFMQNKEFYAIDLRLQPHVTSLFNENQLPHHPSKLEGPLVCLSLQSSIWLFIPSINQSISLTFISVNLFESRWSALSRRRSLKAEGKIWLMVFLERVRCSRLVMLAKSLLRTAGVSRMKKKRCSVNRVPSDQIYYINTVLSWARCRLTLRCQYRNQWPHRDTDRDRHSTPIMWMKASCVPLGR